MVGERLVVRPTTCRRPSWSGRPSSRTCGVEGADNAGDDGFAGEAGAEFLPAPHPRPVGLVAAFGDHASIPELV
jgi:hypothetical protein